MWVLGVVPKDTYAYEPYTEGLPRLDNKAVQVRPSVYMVGYGMVRFVPLRLSVQWGSGH